MHPRIKHENGKKDVAAVIGGLHKNTICDHLKYLVSEDVEVPTVRFVKPVDTTLTDLQFQLFFLLILKNY